MKRIFYLLALLAPAVLIHCKKEAVIEESRLDILTSRQWKLDKLLYSVKGDPTTLNYTTAAYKSCELDDLYEFKKGGVFVRTDGINSCGSVALFAPYGNAGWNIDSSLTNLNVELFAAYSCHFKVVAITGTSLQLDRSTIDYLQREILYTYYFKAGN